ncbi:hypothetical protein, partial [Oenococcus oeni]|uniref:hypothetical protein n=1 Tax=Oenococcus oeni TaxID=1247 RepID=UPI001C5BAA44
FLWELFIYKLFQIDIENQKNINKNLSLEASMLFILMDLKNCLTSINHKTSKSRLKTNKNE